MKGSLGFLTREVRVVAVAIVCGVAPRGGREPLGHERGPQPLRLPLKSGLSQEPSNSGSQCKSLTDTARKNRLHRRAMTGTASPQNARRGVPTRRAIE